MSRSAQRPRKERRRRTDNHAERCHELVREGKRPGARAQGKETGAPPLSLISGPRPSPPPSPRASSHERRKEADVTTTSPVVALILSLSLSLSRARAPSRLLATSRQVLGLRSPLHVGGRRAVKARAAEAEEKEIVKAETTQAPAKYVEPEDTRWGFKPPKVPAIVEAEQQGLRKVNGVKKTGIWFGSEQSLSYLDGTLPGDYGFDPLGVYDPEGEGGVVTQDWLRYAEIIHGRYAMLGAAGCIAPEFLGKVGVIPESTGLIWYKAGVIGPLSEGFSYWSDPYTIFFGQIVLMQFAELRRLQDFKKPGCMKEQVSNLPPLPPPLPDHSHPSDTSG